MEVHDEAETGPGSRWRPAQPAAIALGAFDGVHRGHLAVLAELVSVARAGGLTSVIVAPGRAGERVLGGTALRLAAIAGTGVEHLVLVDDDTRVVDRARGLAPAVVVTGSDHDDGTGVAEVRRIDEVLDDAGVPVRAARVRGALEAGDVAAARGLLGRSYAVSGPVQGGDRRGRELGFPTANVAVEAGVVLPADGVYAGRYRTASGDEYLTAVSIGRRPTFYDDRGLRLVEAYVLDFSGDLYGDEPVIHLDAWVRGQERFDGVEALIAQMHADVARVPTLVAAVR